MLCLRYYKAFPVQRPFFDFCASCDTRSIMRGKFGTVPNANDRTRTTDDDRVIAEARERIASFLVADFARKITGLGYSLHDGAQMVENFNISKEDNTDGNSGS